MIRNLEKTLSMRTFILSVLFIATLTLAQSAQAESGSGSEGSLPKIEDRREDRNLPNSIQERRDLNKDIRNKLIEDRRDDLKDERNAAFKDIRDTRKDAIQQLRLDMPTSSPERRAAIKDIRMEERQEKKELKQTYKKEEFEARRNGLITSLTRVINQLKNAATKIDTRITEAKNAGKNTGNASSLLDSAEAKITTAEQALAAVVAYKPSTSSATSTEITAGTARSLGEAAIKAVREAHAALKEAAKELVNSIKGESLDDDDNDSDNSDDSSDDNSSTETTTNS